MASKIIPAFVLLATVFLSTDAFMAPLPLSARASTRSLRQSVVTMKEEGGGFGFGKMFENAMLKIVETKEKEGTRKKLQPCVFCEGDGKIKCDACEGSGKDIALGQGNCFLCDGKGKRQCEICLGIGMVDRVRRGGTDVAGKWTTKDSTVMDPISAQYEPYVLTLDGEEKYTWCQCGVSTRQPFCDTVSHRAYGIKPVSFKAEGAKGTKTEAKLCGCKYTNTAPYCDGSHVALAAQAEKERPK
eukprot:CAMPEP_0177715274 /NCGR_PEP_ID=MMETSP0484_2-20121128/13905_1 /TAXON_ID=354590 /ORGANISM="Rhodomonas lens, Strain RHODO" /LENGTH=242 /DNA_ID=CAMNT_0019227259 /DNA_START=51 /DNA_END=779 /DNA_ORIENTATION=+